MEFSQPFLKKYSEPEKHQEMQDIISKAYPYCKDIKARSESIQNNLNNFDKDMQKEKDNSRSL